MPNSPSTVRGLPRWLAYCLIFGLYLTLRGYHSRDGDQAYRLPILLHRQDPALFADDPFVRAFDTFNPHVGSLTLLDWVSRPLGLSAGLFGLFTLTFLATVSGIDRLARAVWPELGPRVGLAAVGLVLVAKAGNVGTNHLFEAMLLDRLMAFALGWLAVASAVANPQRGLRIAPICLAAATVIHPSVGLQLAFILGASWLIGLGIDRGQEIGLRALVGGLGWLGLALLPGLLLNVGQGGRLLEGLPLADFRTLSVELQGPQHMVPHLWRLPQWLAWGCYPVLATLAWVERDRNDDSEAAKTRLMIVLGVTLSGLCVAWVAVEVVHDLRVTLFQPFRMATVARGLALVLASGRAVTLWRRGRFFDRARVVLVTIGLAGDWALVIATLFDVTVSLRNGVNVWPWHSLRRAVHLPMTHNVRLGRGRPALPPSPLVGDGRGGGCEPPSITANTTSDSLVMQPPTLSLPHKGGGDRKGSPSWARTLRNQVVAVAVLIGGLGFLARHDTESGHVPLLIGLAVVPLAAPWPRRAWDRRRIAFALVATWSFPALALLLASKVEKGRAPAWQVAVVERCRFRTTPVDDIERLAVWCREHTDGAARFVGPPGPKTFRLWSQRTVVFNRAASPYHAAALGEWFRRFQDHVGEHSAPTTFVRAYQTDRHGLEVRYQAMSDAERAALARRHGATHVIAAPPATGSSNGPLELLHVEGRYAVYRVRPEAATVAESAGTG